MKQQHKKLLTAIQATIEYDDAHAKALPKTGTPYAYLCGRLFAYGRVAESLVQYREYQRLANLCQERIEIGMRLTVGGWLDDTHQRFPLQYRAYNRAEYAAYSEILAMLKEYVGVEPTNTGAHVGWGGTAA